MRLLLLIALALLPLSAALKCKAAGKASGFPPNWHEEVLNPYFASLQSPEECAAGTTHCGLFAAKLSYDSTVADYEESGCVPPALQCATACVEETRQVDFKGIPLTVTGQTCCCNTGDNCDPTKPAPVPKPMALPQLAPKTPTTAAAPVAVTTGAPKPANDTTTAAAASSSSSDPTLLLSLAAAAAAALMGARH